MVKISELKEGDIVKVMDTEIERVGTVLETDKEEKMALIDNGIQEFWYAPEDIIPVPLTDHHMLLTLGFDKEETSEGYKYKKGPFRVLVHDPVIYFLATVDTVFVKNVAGSSKSNTIDIGKTDFASFCFW